MSLRAPVVLILSIALGAHCEIQNVRFANETALLPIGARLAGASEVALGLAGDPSFLGRTPSGLMDVQYPEVVIHHGSLYEDLALNQDEVFLAAPLSMGTLGLGITRVGADGIPRTERGVTPDFTAMETFSVTDWILNVAFAKSWMEGRLRGGTALRLLGHDFDQTGLGAQMDASFVWVQNGWRGGLRMDRGIGGVGVYRSGHSEYTAPDVQAGFGWEKKSSYLYGTLAMAWESAGLLQEQSSSSFTEADVRPWTDPWLALRASRLAVELRTDFGLSLRAGSEIQSLVRVTDFLQGEDEQGLYGESRGSFSIGAGYLWSQRVRVDYALVGHPDLGSTQRISLGIVFGGKSQTPATKPDESKLEESAGKTSTEPSLPGKPVVDGGSEPPETKAVPKEPEEAPEGADVPESSNN
ncbi:MAG: hypothetical protein IPK50_17855 [Fibrobacterota bacterium]|nr:MAG: hypothetical protein IPK50_17855 [Fibrobacterota bacterium]